MEILSLLIAAAAAAAALPPVFSHYLQSKPESLQNVLNACMFLQYRSDTYL